MDVRNLAIESSTFDVAIDKVLQSAIRGLILFPGHDGCSTVFLRKCVVAV